MRHPKRRLGGLEERLDVLRRACPCAGLIVEEALGRFRRAEVGRDDIVDALAAAVTGYVSHGELATIPDPAPRDGEGLPMEMVYYSSQRP